MKNKLSKNRSDKKNIKSSSHAEKYVNKINNFAESIGYTQIAASELSTAFSSLKSSVEPISELMASVTLPEYTYTATSQLSAVLSSLKASVTPISELMASLTLPEHTYTATSQLSAALSNLKASVTPISELMASATLSDYSFTETNLSSTAISPLSDSLMSISESNESISTIFNSVEYSKFQWSTLSEYKDAYFPVMQVYGQEVNLEDLKIENDLNDIEVEEIEYKISDWIKTYNNEFKEQKLFISEEFIETVKNKELTFEYRAKEFAQLMKEDIFEAGDISESEKFILRIIDEENLDYGKKLMNEVYIKNFNNPHIARGILHIISHFDYDVIAPEGETMALASLRHRDIYVIDFGIKAYENWNHKDSLTTLKSLYFEEEWLKDYVKEVIEYIEIYGD